MPQLSPPNHTNISVETSLPFPSRAPQQIPIKRVYPHLQPKGQPSAPDNPNPDFFF